MSKIDSALWVGLAHSFFKEFKHRINCVASYKGLVVDICCDCYSKKYSVGFANNSECCPDWFDSTPWQGGISCCRWCYDEHDDENSHGVIFIDCRASAYGDEFNALWDFIHEWGHTMREPPPKGYVPGKNVLTGERETDAWDQGWVKGKLLCPEIVLKEFDYRRRRDYCLSRYK